MNIKEMLPKSKTDYNSVIQLRMVNKDALRPIIPDLLIWLQDINWPISSDIGEIVLQFNAELIPYIQEILKTDDDIWKYYILTEVVSKLSKEAKLGLIDELNRLSKNPSEGEREERVDLKAIKIIESLDRD